MHASTAVPVECLRRVRAVGTDLVAIPMNGRHVKERTAHPDAVAMTDEGVPVLIIVRRLALVCWRLSLASLVGIWLIPHALAPGSLMCPSPGLTHGGLPSVPTEQWVQFALSQPGSSSTAPMDDDNFRIERRGSGRHVQVSLCSAIDDGLSMLCCAADRGHAPSGSP